MSAEDTLSDDQFGRKFPTHAVIKGIGRVRVTDYHGRGYFSVLDNRDTQRFVHRDRLTFVKGGKRETPG